jgi:leucyl aminopeptidase
MHACVAAGEVKKVVGLVGKGVTFDSGGYNLKVGGMIDMMKFDMGGAAAVLGAAQALTSLQPPGVQARALSLQTQLLFFPLTQKLWAD